MAMLLVVRLLAITEIPQSTSSPESCQWVAIPGTLALWQRLWPASFPAATCPTGQERWAEGLRKFEALTAPTSPVPRGHHSRPAAQASERRSPKRPFPHWLA